MAACNDCGCSLIVETARDLGVSHCLAVPGAPITHLAEVASSSFEFFEWSLNEKTAVEVAVGLSVVGRRSLVMCKQNGLNVALDPLMNAATHTIARALVVVVGDDVDSTKSTVIQDSRAIAELARIPVVEPIDGFDLSHSIRLALELSEQSASPTLVRLTAHPRASASFAASRAAAARSARGVEHYRGQGFPVPTLNRGVAQELTKLGRVQRHRLRWSEIAARVLDEQQVADDDCHGDHQMGTIYVGDAARLYGGTGCHLKVRTSSVFGEGVQRFLQTHGSVVVVEEPLPYFEDKLLQHLDCSRPSIIGRRSGHLPPESSLSSEDVERAQRGGPLRAWDDVEKKGRRTYDPLEYSNLFGALALLGREGVFVCADVGVAVELCYAPHAASDVALCLGSAPAVASGAARGNRPAIAVIGDYGLLHTALPSLIEIAYRRVPALVVVMVNGRQAKTGGQPVITELLSDDIVEVLTRVCVGLGFSVIEDWQAMALPVEETADRLRHLLSHGPAIALVVDPTTISPEYVLHQRQLEVHIQ